MWRLAPLSSPLCGVAWWPDPVRASSNSPGNGAWSWSRQGLRTSLVVNTMQERTARMNTTNVLGRKPITRGHMDTFIQFQYDDLATKSQDLYAATKYAIVQRYLREQSKLRILNVGCGSGELSLQLAAKGHNVLGIDIEPAHIALARENATRAGSPPNCEFIAAPIEDFRWSHQFDGIVCTDVLEHIQDDHAAFARMMSLLRPGGQVVLAVPAGQCLFGYHDEQLGHFRRYSKTTLRRLVERSCDIQRLRYFGFTLVPVCLLYSKWVRRPYPVAESGDRQRSPVRSLVLRGLMHLDRMLPMPLGISLLMKGVKKPSTIGSLAGPGHGPRDSTSPIIVTGRQKFLGSNPVNRPRNS
jgi:2-polyprenyl-3-methyl-5-hydroxy-6-metoxy-1,4-benzoquinol methylase